MSEPQRPPSALRWVVTDILTGTPLAWLGGCVEASTPLRHTIGQYDSGNVTLWLSDAPEGWDRLVAPLTTVWHAYRDDDPTVVLWSGTIAVNPAEAGSGKVDLGLSTIEYYLDRRLIDYTWNDLGSDVGQNEIVNQLVKNYINDASETTGIINVNIDGTLVTNQAYTYPGIPLRVVKLDGDGTPRARRYVQWDQASVYQRMQELSAVQGGPEWTIDWAWESGVLVPTLSVGSRLGSSPAAGLGPAAMFRLPGNLVSATYTQDYSDGKGANSVWATGSGQGVSTPTSDRYVTGDMRGRPTVSLAIQPSTSITKHAALNKHAAQTLAELRYGSDSLTMSASLSSPATPVFGRDFHLGDDVGYRLGGWDAQGVDLVPEMPGGKHGTARVLAVEIDPAGATMTPIVKLNGSAQPINTGSRTTVDGAGGEPRFVLGGLPGGLIDGRH